MEKLDRLGWADGVTFVSHGVRIGIRVNDATIVDRLQELLPPGSITSASPVVQYLYSLVVGSNGQRANVRAYNLLYVGLTRLARTMDREDVFHTLEEHLHLLVAIAARRRVFVRAGVVGWRGKAVVIPGSPSTELTSLLGALVRSGATYYSNTYAVLDTRGRVHAYPAPPREKATESTRTATRAVGGRGSWKKPKPLPVGLIALPEQEAQPSCCAQELSHGQAVLRLLAHTVSTRVRPALTLAVLGRSVTGAVALKTARGELEAEAATHLLERLEASGTSTVAR